MEQVVPGMDSMSITFGSSKSLDVGHSVWPSGLSHTTPPPSGEHLWNPQSQM